MPEAAQIFFESLGTAADVTGLVGRPEDLYFDAKTCSIPFSDNDKDHLAEALSGFANSDGGTMIYGLTAKGGDRVTPDVVTGVDPVRDVARGQAEVLHLVGQLAEPPVAGVRVEARELSGLPNRGFILVYVPASDLVHRSRRDREFYRRHGTGFYRMEHYEIAEMFGRRRRPQLRIWTKLKGYGRSGGSVVSVYYVVGLENVGRGIAKFPGVKLSNVRINAYGVDGNMKFGLPQRPLSDGANVLYAGGLGDAIHSGANLEVTVIEYPMPGTFDERFEYELYAEDMVTVKGTHEVNVGKTR